MLALSSCTARERATSFEYEKNSDGYAITDMNPGTQTYVQIPDNYLGVPVTELRFQKIGTKVETIEIPESVRTLCDNFGYGNKSVKRVLLPSTLENVGECFFHQSSLEEISVTPGGKYTSVDGVMYTTDMKTLVKYPDCKRGDVFVFPGSVEAMSEYSLDSVKSLKEITVSDKLTVLSVGAFGWCESLETVNLGSGVREIQKYSFVGSENLKNINVKNENPYFSTLAGHLVSKNKNKLVRYASGRSENGVCKIPDGIVIISENACYSHNTLKTLVIPDTVEEIGYGAFEACDNLESVTVGKNVNYIDVRAFASYVLKYIYFTDKIGWSVSETGLKGTPIDVTDPKRNAKDYNDTYADYSFVKSVIADN